ncbi:MAG: Crossover junction endodeoxyribonuclease RuvC (plasmid) [Chroococcopsis gigantea SAG 12.99]|jgi:crossover junction endodeoxyribonuclease RuvC|nr:Crossover junction endodeoxyribonuclease RuvC [Chroococcopsis gigantea SAG 12.99]
MANYRPKIDHLKKQKPKWKHLPTHAIRVPVVFSERIESFARELDNKPEQPEKRSPIWMGIKPSISQLGWAFIEDTGREARLLDYGTSDTDPHQPLPQRLVEIEADLNELIDQFHPSHVALETPFINTSYPSGRKLLQVLGIVNAIIYRSCHCLPVNIYAPQWKSHIDSPRAERHEIAEIVQSLFDIPSLPMNSCVDAIAIAYAGYCGVGEQNR